MAMKSAAELVARQRKDKRGALATGSTLRKRKETTTDDPASSPTPPLLENEIDGKDEEWEEEICFDGSSDDTEEEEGSDDDEQEKHLTAAEDRYVQRRAYSASDSGFSSGACTINTSDDDDESTSSTEKGSSIILHRKQHGLPEIEPVYASDSSDDEVDNTVGNIPMEWYDEYPHIGYDVNGKKIFKPITKDALDAFLDNVDGPDAGKTVHDELTGKDIKLTKEELRMIKRIHAHAYPDASFDAYEKTIEWFTSQTEIMPISAAPEPKRRFVPSKHEASRIMKIARAIRRGYIVPGNPDKQKQANAKSKEFYNIWEDNASPLTPHIMHISAPKMKLPQHNASYNPPAEFLLDTEEMASMLALDPEDRPIDFIPQKFPNLRSVPGYPRFLQERFNRCLDLYLCPRTVKKKLDIDPNSLIPNLPSPRDLRPFPTHLSISYRGHVGRVRSISVDPCGQLLASGGDDGWVRVWEVCSGKCLQAWKLPNTVLKVSWNPNASVCMLACSWEHNVSLIIPDRVGGKRGATASTLLNSIWSAPIVSGLTGESQQLCQWVRPKEAELENGVLAHIEFSPNTVVSSLVFHRKGDYFATLVAGSGVTSASAVLIHQISRRSSQNPFKKVKGGSVNAIHFHPTKPVFFVATQRYVRVYNLMKQELVKTLQTGAKWISSMAVHPQGDNVIVGTYDRRLNWFDMDLSTKPFKTLRYHAQAIRDVAFSPAQPLFASASDDGLINIFHGMVYNDLMKNPLIVPVKRIKAHSVVEGGLGVLGLAFHPQQPWLFSCGADGGIHMFC